MSARQHIRPRPVRRSEPAVRDVVEEATPPPSTALDNIDDLLDEIDALLEDQSVLLSYRQRSGQ